MRSCRDDEVSAALEALDTTPRIIPARAWPGDLVGLEEAGLYSWWVDDTGAGDISKGLALDVLPGRIYAGQAGATRWPSGTSSAATLGSRIRSQHLGGTIYGSTFRLTLASCLAARLGLVASGRKRLGSGGEALLSRWIHAHLSVAIHAYPNRDSLEDLEHRVLFALDPPLNIRGMSASPIRSQLGAARKRLVGPASRGVSRAIAASPRGAPTSTSIVDRVTLHEEIADILREQGNRWMSTQEIADEVNARGRYRKRDGPNVTAFQIHGRTRNYGDLFERQGSNVRLIETG